jgi:hypothetical protein
MKLPKRDLPEYETTLPVADLVVKYRPYTVKEQKIMMMAAAGNDPTEIVNSIKQVIENCTNVNWGALCDADFEFLFTRLMSVSISNVAAAEFSHDCGADGCPTAHQTSINLDNIQVIGLDKLKDKYVRRKNYWVVPFDEESGICMKQTLSMTNQNETIFNSVVSIYDADGVYDEFNEEELSEYLDGLLNEDFEKINEFINTQPYCFTNATATCTKCSKKIQADLKGVLDFFV